MIYHIDEFIISIYKKFGLTIKNIYQCRKEMRNVCIICKFDRI